MESEENRRLSSPATRLHSFLLQGRGVNNINASNFLQDAFGLGESSLSELYRNYAQILNLVKTTREALERSNSQFCKPCIEALPRIRSALERLQMNSNWAVVDSGINDGDISLLAMAATILEQENYEQCFSAEEVSEFHSVIDELEEEISSGELPEELKLILEDLLSDLKQGLNDYPITGIDGLKDALAMAFGKIALNKHIFEGNRDLSAIEKFGKFMDRVVNSVALIGMSSQAGVSVAGLIE